MYDGSHSCSIGAEKEEYLRRMWNTVPLESLDPDIGHTVDDSSSCDFEDGSIWEEQKIPLDWHHEWYLAVDCFPSRDGLRCSYVQFVPHGFDSEADPLWFDKSLVGVVTAEAWLC
jgi:hypothetical protein